MPHRAWKITLTERKCDFGKGGVFSPTPTPPYPNKLTKLTEQKGRGSVDAEYFSGAELAPGVSKMKLKCLPKRVKWSPKSAKREPKRAKGTPKGLPEASRHFRLVPFRSKIH